MSLGLVVIHPFDHFLQIGERIIHPHIVDKVLASHPSHVVKVQLTEEEKSQLTEPETVIEDQPVLAESIEDDKGAAKATTLSLPAPSAASKPPKADPSGA